MKKILVLSLMLILFFSFAGVSASDINDTLGATDNSDVIPIGEPINQSGNGSVSSNGVEEDKMARDEVSLDVGENIDDNDSLASFNDNIIKSAKSSNDLKDIIQNAADGSVIELDSDYIFSSRITINKNISIDGKGHTLNGNKQSGIFNVQEKAGVYLYNITFINAIWSGGVISNYGNVTLNNCYFKNNYANGVDRSSSYTTNNDAIVSGVTQKGGPIYNGGNLNIIDCIFENNGIKSESYCQYPKSATTKGYSISTSYGGVIYNSAKLNIFNSSFIENSVYSYSYIYSTRSELYAITYSYGGVIYNSAELNINNSNFTGNKVYSHSHIFLNGTGNPSIESYVRGGVIYNTGSSILNNIVMENNTAKANSTAKVLTVNPNAILCKSNAIGRGGAIFNSGNLTAMNFSFKNTGLYSRVWDEFTIGVTLGSNCIFDGADIYNTGRFTMSGNISYNDSYEIFPFNYNKIDYEQIYGHGRIYNSGTLNILNSLFNGSFRINPSVNIYSINQDKHGIYGGLIYNENKLSVKNSSFIDNSRLTNYPWIHGSYIYNKGVFSIDYSNFTNKGYDPIMLSTKGSFKIYNSNLYDFKLSNNCSKLEIFNSSMTYTPISTENSINNFYNDIFKYKGITSSNASLNMNNCSFIKSSNYYGGAIHSSDSHIDVSNSKFIDGYAGQDGGAIWGTEKCDVNIYDSTFVNNKAFDEGGALCVYKLNANNCTFINNRAEYCAAIKVIESGSLINRSLFYGNSVNNKTDEDYICYLNKGTIMNSIFLNNTAESLFDNSNTLDYNWFGSTVDDYLVKPINDTSLNNWAFLNIAPNFMVLEEKRPIQFIFQVWDGNNVSDYNTSNLPGYELSLNCTNGELDKTSILTNEIVLYTANEIDNNSITAKFFDKELTINLTCKYPAKITANESITIIVDQFMKFDEEGLCARLIPSDIGELIYSTDNDTILNITDNGFKGIIGGTANIIVEFKGNDKYAPNKICVPVTVLKYDVEIIVVDHIIMDYWATERIQANLTPNVGNLIFKECDKDMLNVYSSGLIHAARGVGNTTVNVIFEGNERYNAANKTVKVTVNKIDSAIRFTKDITFNYGTSGFTYATLFDGVIDIKASVYNHSEANVTIDDHKITVSNLDAGTYTLVVTTIPDKNHNSVNATCPITVQKVVSTIDIPTTSFDYDDSITVNVTLMGAIGLTDVKVENHPEALIYVNGTSITISGLDAGTYTLSTSTIPDENHNVARSSEKIIINKVNSEIEFSNNLVFNYGDSDYTVANTKYSTNLTNVYVENHPEAIIKIKNNIITVSGLNAGNYTLYASTVPDKNHNSVTGSTKITVNKVYSTLNIEKDIIFNYGSSNFTYATFDGANSIKANVTGNLATVDVDGNKITVSGLNAGNYSLYVYTVPDGNHISVNTTVKITVNKADPKITVSPISFNYGQTGSAKILTDDNVNIEGKVINHPEAIVSISNKIIAISNLDAGNYKLEVNTHSTNNYNPITLTTDITVNKIQPTISVSDIVCDYGTSGSTKVILDGASKFNANINGDSNHLTINNNVINVNGLDAGTYTLTVTTVSDNNHDAATSISKIVVNRLNTVLTSASVSKFYGTSKNIVIKLNDVNGNLLVGESVKVRINNVDYYGKVNSKGHAVIAVPTNLAVKTYTATISYDGNANYEKSTLAIKVTVKKATPKITAKAKTFKKSVKTKKYTITLKNNLNKVMKNTKVTIKINKKTFTAKTNSKGVATFKITKLTKNGTFKSVITYKGSKYYNKVTKTVNIKVK